MTKKNVMISVDEHVHKRAKEKGLSISGVCESALIKNINPIKSDAPDNALQLRCTQCHKLIDYGFLCEYRDMFLCQECEDKFDKRKCQHDKRGEHEHMQIPGLQENNKEIIKKGFIGVCVPS